MFLLNSPDKKLLTTIASILNPVFYEVASNTDKVTPAGLVGTVDRKNGEIFSRPGYLPLASHGVLAIQDFHELTKNIDKYSGILSMVMEDGKVIDSTSAKKTHNAITSIHVDMNRVSQVKEGININAFGDLNIPLNIISRFDFIMEIPADVKSRGKLAQEIISGEEILGSSLGRPKQQEWAKILRRIIVYLSTTFLKIRIPADVSEYLKNSMEQISKEFEGQKNIDKMLVRIAVSVKKFVKAIACAEMTDTVTIQHVDEALSFINSKLEFLKNYDENHTAEIKISKADKIQERRDSLLEKFSGKHLSIKDICSELEVLGLGSIGQRTITRDLEELENQGLIKHAKHGEWEFPERKSEKDTQRN